VTKPPYNADNTGKTDCSEAIQAAFTHANKTTNRFATKDERAIKILYFPAGTYLITKQLDFRYQEGKRRVQKPGFMMIYGESKERARILLAPNSPTFQDRPRPVIAFTNSKSSNNSYHNSVRNITLEIGENNRGAIGFHFVSSNVGSMENVICRNLDTENPAYRGISLPVVKGGLSYLTNIRIEGFRTGICRNIAATR
jgi:hypothetical protein